MPRPCRPFGFLKDYFGLNFSVNEIVETYRVGSLKTTTRYFLSGIKLNNVFAAKCAKRGNDVYHIRVESRFRGQRAQGHKAEILVFFNPKERNDKRTSALWTTLTYDTIFAPTRKYRNK